MTDAFEQIAQFQYSAEAMIVKGKLEAEGVPVFVRDNHTVDSDPLVSNAIGGVKLMVRHEDVGKARSILSEISPYSLDDTGKPLHCPKCGSSEIELQTSVKDSKSLFAFLFSFLLMALPIYTQYRYKCTVCQHEF